MGGEGSLQFRGVDLVSESLLVVEEVLEHPQLAELEDGDALAPLDDIEGGCR
jgi:hypothetical protein